jgi:hypothetical protein
MQRNGITFDHHRFGRIANPQFLPGEAKSESADDHGWGLSIRLDGWAPYELWLYK